jgi:hypothetical protein
LAQRHRADDAAYKDAQARAHLDEGAAKRSALNRVEQGSCPRQRTQRRADAHSAEDPEQGPKERAALVPNAEVVAAAWVKAIQFVEQGGDGDQDADEEDCQEQGAHRHPGERPGGGLQTGLPGGVQEIVRAPAERCLQGGADDDAPAASCQDPGHGTGQGGQKPSNCGRELPAHGHLREIGFPLVKPMVPEA